MGGRQSTPRLKASALDPRAAGRIKPRGARRVVKYIPPPCNKFRRGESLREPAGQFPPISTPELCVSLTGKQMP